MKLSIIVPVYNTKNQIDTCIKSIVNQIDREVEVMIINDASTDNSEEIILEYKNQYPNIKYYSKKENTGLADTRNIGIDKAKGEYIMFVDSDDYIEKDLLKNLNKYMKDKYEVIQEYTFDGVRLEFKDFWFSLRKSNTEPYLRLVLEATSKKVLYEKLVELMYIINKYKLN